MGNIKILSLFLWILGANMNLVYSQDNLTPEQKMEALGIQLATPTSPLANYVSLVRSGNLIFLAGAGPKLDNGKYITGKVGQTATVEEAYAAARLTAIRQLEVLKAELGSLNKIKRIVKVFGMVNSTPDFEQHPAVINGFSDLMVEIFDENGKHARSAVGLCSLPFNMLVEVEMIVEINNED